VVFRLKLSLGRLVKFFSAHETGSGETGPDGAPPSAGKRNGPDLHISSRPAALRSRIFEAGPATAPDHMGQVDGSVFDFRLLRDPRKSSESDFVAAKNIE
jgi:hypothetical protein